MPPCKGQQKWVNFCTLKLALLLSGSLLLCTFLPPLCDGSRMIQSCTMHLPHPLHQHCSTMLLVCTNGNMDQTGTTLPPRYPLGGAYLAAPAAPTAHPAARNLRNYLRTKAIHWCIHTYVFYVTYTPIRCPIFGTIFTFLGLFPPQMVHLLPVPNMEWAVYELCVVRALGTPQTARVW